jgi:hypothetical protein
MNLQQAIFKEGGGLNIENYMDSFAFRTML